MAQVWKVLVSGDLSLLPWPLKRTGAWGLRPGHMDIRAVALMLGPVPLWGQFLQSAVPVLSSACPALILGVRAQKARGIATAQEQRRASEWGAGDWLEQELQVQTSSVF